MIACPSYGDEHYFCKGEMCWREKYMHETVLYERIAHLSFIAFWSCAYTSAFIQDCPHGEDKEFCYFFKGHCTRNRGILTGWSCNVTFLQNFHVSVTRKQTLRSLLLSYSKKDGHAWPRPSFFWYDTDFLEFESFYFIDCIL